MARSYITAVRSEILRHQSRQGLVSKADIVEFALDFERAKIGWQVKPIDGIRGVQNEIEAELEWLSPAVLTSPDELLSSHAQSIIFLVR